MSDFEQWYGNALAEAIANGDKDLHKALCRNVGLYKYGFEAAIASMQGEAIGFFGGHRHYPQGTSEFFGWVYDADLRIEKGTKLFTYPPSAAAKIAEQKAEIARLTKELEEARKDAGILRAVSFHIEEAIRNGMCNFEIEQAYEEATAALTQSKGGAE